MLRQATAERLQDVARSDSGAPHDIDYDVEYGALDLMPGAPLWEIQDRGRLLRTAFEPNGLPGPLGMQAARRVRRIGRAADLLSRYWQTHGAAPPSARAVRSGTKRRDDGRDRLAGLSGFSFMPALVPPLAALPSRPPLAAEAARSPARADASRKNGGARSAVRPPAIASRSRAEPIEAQRRRPLAVAGSVLLKAALVGLVIAAAVRVQQYRANHPSLSPYSEPSKAVAPSLPAAPPVHWPGITVAGRPMSGAMAPAIIGHRRRD